jgi:hypothetical protein
MGVFGVAVIERQAAAAAIAPIVKQHPKPVLGYPAGEGDKFSIAAPTTRR